MSTTPHFRFSRKFDLCTLSQHSHFLSWELVDEAHKRKSQKVQPVDLDLSDGYKPNGSDVWRKNAIKREIPILDSTDKYTYWLILKFTPIAKGARLTLERLSKIIIGDGMTTQKKDVLTEILYNREAVLA